MRWFLVLFLHFVVMASSLFLYDVLCRFIWTLMVADSGLEFKCGHVSCLLNLSRHVECFFRGVLLPQRKPNETL